MNSIIGKPNERLLEQYAMHPLTADERVTTESMLQDPSSRVMVMPTHHINELGDMMGFRFTCNAHAAGNHLPVVRTMFHGHTLVESKADEALIMQLMSQPERNRERMQDFLRRVEAECVPASLDCVPENASSHTRHGTLEATGLLTVDSQHWTPEVPERIGVYHAYVRGFNRDVRVHRLFLVCSGGMSRASDAFCNLVIDAGKNCTAQVQRGKNAPGKTAPDTPPTTGNLRLTGGVVAAQGVPARAVPHDQGPGRRIPDPHPRRAGLVCLCLAPGQQRRALPLAAAGGEQAPDQTPQPLGELDGHIRALILHEMHARPRASPLL
jgi:hypothetical protein